MSDIDYKSADRLQKTTNVGHRLQKTTNIGHRLQSLLIDYKRLQNVGHSLQTY